MIDAVTETRYLALQLAIDAVKGNLHPSSECTDLAQRFFEFLNNGVVAAAPPSGCDPSSPAGVLAGVKSQFGAPTADNASKAKWDKRKAEHDKQTLDKHKAYLAEARNVVTFLEERKDELDATRSRVSFLEERSALDAARSRVKYFEEEIAKRTDDTTPTT